MSSYTDLMQMCRLCLVKEQVNLPIFDGQGELQQIFLKITACLPVKVSREDNLPKSICDGCSYKLDLLYQFWNTSSNSEKQLIDWLTAAGVDPKHTSNEPIGLAGQSDVILKQEPVTELDAISSDAQNYIIQQQQLAYKPEEYEESQQNAKSTKNKAVSEAGDEPSPKRPRRATRNSKSVREDDSDDDYVDTTVTDITKTEDDTEDDDDDDDGEGDDMGDDGDDMGDPDFVANEEDTEQPGPSGVGGAKASSGPKIASLGDIKKYIAALRVSKGSVYPCSVCKSSFQRKTSLKSHMFTHLADPMVKCPECSQMCRNRLRLWRHLYEVHKDETKRQVCQVCGERFVFQRDLLNHTCPEDFKFMEKCKLCETILNSHKAVHQHMKWHKNADKSFICDICGQTLTTKGNLKLHKMAIHEGVKIKKKRIKHGPRFCELCGKTVSHDLFKTHMNIHNGIKPFKCKYCEKAFPSYLRLREHVRTHTGERPYVCTVCEKGFTQSHSLKTHMKSVHNIIKPKGQQTASLVRYDEINTNS